jgi:hypothetical protein
MRVMSASKTGNSPGRTGRVPAQRQYRDLVMGRWLHKADPDELGGAGHLAERADPDGGHVPIGVCLAGGRVEPPSARKAHQARPGGREGQFQDEFLACEHLPSDPGKAPAGEGAKVTAGAGRMDRRTAAGWGAIFAGVRVVDPVQLVLGSPMLAE